MESTAPPPPFVCRLPRAVWLLVTQFVSLSDKLIHLTHLSRSFPLLSPTSFTRDHLCLSSSALSALTSSTSLPQQLGAVSSISYDCTQTPCDTWRALECFSTLLSCHSFTALHSLDLLLPQDAALLSPLLDSLFPTATTCPALHSLVVSTACDGDESSKAVQMKCAALLRLPSLTRLTLGQVVLDAVSVRHICALPALLHLDLGTCVLPSSERSVDSLAAVTAPSGEVEGYQPFEVAGRWQSLVLPGSNSDELFLLHATSHWNSRAAADDHGAGDGKSGKGGHLLHLRCQLGAHSPALHDMASLQTLTSLNLHASAWDWQRVDDFSFLVDPSTLQPRLPHLVHFAAPVSTHLGCPGACQHLHPNCLEFLSAYSQQLQSLFLTALHPCACQLLVEAAFRCAELRKLALCALYSRAHTAERCDAPQRRPLSTSLPTLPLLHTLIVSRLPLTEADLAVLFHSSPAVEDLQLKRLTALTVDVLPVLGRACPRLRRLRLEHNDRFFTPQADDQALMIVPPTEWSRAEESQVSLFPSLVSLSCVLSHDAVFRFHASAVVSLVSMLESAPSLRYLRLDVALNLYHQRVFERLTRLRAFRLWYETPDDVLERFFTANRGVGRRRRVRQREKKHAGFSPEETEVVSDFELEHSWEQVEEFPHLFVHTSSTDGRAAFFESLPLFAFIV